MAAALRVHRAARHATPVRSSHCLADARTQGWKWQGVLVPQGGVWVLAQGGWHVEREGTLKVARPRLLPCIAWHMVVLVRGPPPHHDVSTGA